MDKCKICRRNVDKGSVCENCKSSVRRQFNKTKPQIKMRQQEMNFDSEGQKSSDKR